MRFVKGGDWVEKKRDGCYETEKSHEKQGKKQTKV